MESETEQDEEFNGQFTDVYDPKLRKVRSLHLRVSSAYKLHSHFKLDYEVSICSLIPPAMAISIARTKGNNSKGPGPMALIFFPTIQLVILVMCTKFQVSR